MINHVVKACNATLEKRVLLRHNGPWETVHRLPACYIRMGGNLFGKPVSTVNRVVKLRTF